MGVGLGGRGGNSGSQPGESHFWPGRGGTKIFHKGGDRGGNKDKIFLKFQKTAKILSFAGKY